MHVDLPDMQAIAARHPRLFRGHNPRAAPPLEDKGGRPGKKISDSQLDQLALHANFRRR
jgi:hypothetical protein